MAVAFLVDSDAREYTTSTLGQEMDSLAFRRWGMKGFPTRGSREGGRVGRPRAMRSSRWCPTTVIPSVVRVLNNSVPAHQDLLKRPCSMLTPLPSTMAYTMIQILPCKLAKTSHLLDIIIRKSPPRDTRHPP